MSLHETKSPYTLKVFMKRLWALYSSFRYRFLTMFVFVLVFEIISTTYPFFYGRLVNAISDKNVELFIIFGLAWFGMRLLGLIVNYFQERFEISKTDYDFPRFVSKSSLENVLGFSLGQLLSESSGVRRTVLNEGESAIRDLAQMFIHRIVPIILGMIIPSIILLFVIPPVGILIAAATIIFIAYTLFVNKRFIPDYIRLRKKEQASSRVVSDIHSNQITVITEAKESRAVHMVNEEKLAIANTGIPLWLAYIKKWYGGQSIVFILNMASVAVAGYLVIQGNITFAIFVSTIGWIGQAVGELGKVGNIYREAIRHYASIVRYFQTLDIEPEVKMPDKPVQMGSYAGDIIFDNVTFSYPKRKNKLFSLIEEENTKDNDKDISNKIAVDQVSFTLAQGGRYAFVGSSGACKSTLVNLIVRAWDPQNGKIMVAGHDIKNFDFRDYREHIGVVPQQVELFDASIRDNILFGVKDPNTITDDDMKRACKIARVDEFVDHLEHGLDTMIGERGIKLSGGQRQRVGIARAVIKKPDLLVFDEATSSLDAVNEKLVHEAIAEASEGVTTIIIAHRLATVSNADKILVFEGGRMVGEGRHEDLLASNNVYQKLVKHQLVLESE